jgi:hypothetical protein
MSPAQTCVAADSRATAIVVAACVGVTVFAAVVIAALLWLHGGFRRHPEEVEGER